MSALRESIEAIVRSGAAAEKDRAREVFFALQTALDRGVEEGWITPPTRRGLGPVRRQRSDRSAATVLADDRDED